MQTNLTVKSGPLQVWRLVAVQAYWLGHSFMWNSLHVILLPAILVGMVPEALKNTYLGVLTFLGLILAVIVQPISGDASDRWVSRWGRRRPLMAAGLAIDLLFLGVLAWAGGVLWLAVGYIGLQLGSNIVHGPAQGLIPDQVPKEQLGLASGIKNLLDMIGLALASLLMGRLFTLESPLPRITILFAALVLILGAAVTFLSAGEQPWQPGSRPVGGKQVFQAFHVDWRSQRGFAVLIASRFFFLLAIYGIQGFIQYFIRDVIAAEDPVRLTGDLLAAITLSIMAFALLGGRLGDRFGHKKVLYLACLLSGLGSLSLAWVRSEAALFASGMLFGVGVGLFLTGELGACDEVGA